MDHTFILLLTLFVPFSYQLQVQEEITPGLLDDVDLNDATNYEIIPIRHKLHKRNINEMAIQTKINGVEQEIYLNPSEGHLADSQTRVLTVETNPRNPGQLLYKLIPNVIERSVVQFFHDQKTMSSITHTINKRGLSEFNGILNNLVIRPLPDHLRKRRDLLRANFSSFESEAEGFVDAEEHIIHKRAARDFYNNDFKSNVVDYPSVFKKSKTELPKVLYPEVLVFVDEVLFRKVGYNIEKAVQYILSFYNAVDLRYRDLSTPKVFINIAAIVLCKDELRFVKASEYLNGVHSGILMKEFGKYLLKNNIFKMEEDYDVALFMTGRNIRNENGTSLNGISYFMGACRQTDDQIVSVGLVHDDIGYSKIITAAHELAHLLGAEHDSDPASEGYGGPGAKQCPWGDGYIMSYERINRNKLFFSKCSKKGIAFYASRENAECLRDNPTKKSNAHQLQRILPGKYMTLDQQCQNRGYPRLYAAETNCLELSCSLDNGYHVTSGLPPADGSTCGEGKYCLAGECIKDTTGRNQGLSTQNRRRQYQPVNRRYQRQINTRMPIA